VREKGERGVGEVKWGSKLGEKGWKEGGEEGKGRGGGGGGGWREGRGGGGRGRG